MKKTTLILVAAAALSGSAAFGQSSQNWSSAGNSVSSGSFLGTTNSEPLLFKANNSTAGSFQTNGEFRVNQLSGTGNRLIYSNTNGGLSSLAAPANTNKVLNGSLQWVDASSLVFQPWIKQSGTPNIYFNSNVGIGNSSPLFTLDVTGNARVSNSITVGNFAMKSYPSTDASPAVLVFGPVQEGPPDPPSPPFFDACLYGQVTVPTVNAFSGLISSGTNLTGIGPIALDMGSDGAHGIIESRGSNESNPGSEALLLNYYCGQNIYMCSGTNAGFVRVGKNFEVGNVTRNATVAANISGGSNMTGLSVSSTHTSDFGYNTLLTVDRNLTKALTVLDNGAQTPMETFTVLGNGSTSIVIPNPVSTPDAFTVKDGSGNAVNFKVKTNGFVYAREVTIQTGAFPDYVFAPGYKLMPLGELDNYIKTNKHLPGFAPEKKYVQEGMNTGELLVKQQEKIEELTLYIIELEKRMKKLEENH